MKGTGSRYLSLAGIKRPPCGERPLVSVSLP
jgi:hypothetical protein